jgi:hypothetical protein
LLNNGKDKAITALVADENVKEITADVEFQDCEDVASPKEVLETLVDGID